MILGYVNPNPAATDKFSTSPRPGWIQVENTPDASPIEFCAKVLAELLNEINDDPETNPQLLIKDKLQEMRPWDGVIRESDFIRTIQPARGASPDRFHDIVKITHKPTGLAAQHGSIYKSQAASTTIAKQALLQTLHNYKAHHESHP